MLVEDDLDFRRPAQRLVEVRRPLQRVAHFGTAQGVEVVQGVTHHLGAAERLELRQVEDELGRRLAVGHVVEDECASVDLYFLPGLVDHDRRRQDAHAAVGHGLSEAVVDQALGVARQVLAVHVHRAAAHRRGHHQVLAGGFLHEADGCHHGHAALPGFLGGDHSQGPAEVIDMAVREDDARHRLVAQMLPCEGHRGSGVLARGGGVDHDPAGLALDQREVGQVEAAQLPDAVGHLEQADLVVQQRLAPQAGVDRGRSRALHEGEAVVVPDEVALHIPDLARGRGDEAALGVGKGCGVGQVGRLRHGGVGLLHGGRDLAARAGRSRLGAACGQAEREQRNGRGRQ